MTDDTKWLRKEVVSLAKEARDRGLSPSEISRTLVGIGREIRLEGIEEERE